VSRQTRPLTQKQVNVLFVISQNEPCPVSEVARHLHMDESNARSTCTSLERRGYVDRQYTGQRNVRGYSLVTTAAGEEALAKADPDTEDAEDEDWQQFLRMEQRLSERREARRAREAEGQ
jgi:DNA-binding MarR family transcriptional regulator